jgi:hypothetical protein
MNSDRFDWHIYETICEITLKMFKETNFIDYRSYCHNSLFVLRDNDENSIRIISRIHRVLRLLYGFNIDETIDYVFSFFECNLYIENEKYISKLIYFFPDVGSNIDIYNKIKKE